MPPPRQLRRRGISRALAAATAPRPRGHPRLVPLANPEIAPAVLTVLKISISMTRQLATHRKVKFRGEPSNGRRRLDFVGRQTAGHFRGSGPGNLPILPMLSWRREWDSNGRIPLKTR